MQQHYFLAFYPFMIYPSTLFVTYLIITALLYKSKRKVKINKFFMVHSLFEIYSSFNGFYAGYLNLIAFISIFSGILIVITKNPIVSVLYLILLFSNISVYLIFVGLVFIGLSYLLVYVGAVSILFLFILMLINIRVSELIGDTNNNIPLAIFTTLAFFIPISDILPRSEKDSNPLLFFIHKPEQISHVSSFN